MKASLPLEGAGVQPYTEPYRRGAWGVREVGGGHGDSSWTPFPPPLVGRGTYESWGDMGVMDPPFSWGVGRTRGGIDMGTMDPPPVSWGVGRRPYTRGGGTWGSWTPLSWGMRRTRGGGHGDPGPPLSWGVGLI